MSLTRVKLTGMDVDAAIRKTLKNGFCRFPEFVPAETLTKLHTEVSNKLVQSANKAETPAGNPMGVGCHRVQHHDTTLHAP